MSNEKLYVVEWTIENFSCWKGEIHDKVITSLETSIFLFKFELFPRGLSGQDEHLALRIGGKYNFLVCELSLFSSDGSLLYFQKGLSKECHGVIDLPPGPKFEDVVARIRKNKAVHGDRLTLRFSDWNLADYVECMSATIDVVNFNVKISYRTFDDAHNELISVFEYPLDDGRMGQIHLLASKDEKKRLVLKPEPFLKNFLVRTEMLVLNDEYDVARSEEDEHLFRDDSAWMFSNLHATEDVILRLKVIPSNRYKPSVGPITQSNTYKRGIEVTALPSSVFKFHVSEDYFFKPDNSTKVLKKELMCLFQDQDFSDFQLKCDNISFPVHRAILCARSPVFKTMLTSDMKESVSCKVDIKDLDATTLGLFLTYLYTGIVKDLQSDRAIKLYYAADKYQVPSLKRKCVNFLPDNISIWNVCDILSLGDRHRDDQLTTAARSFMIMNYNAVLKSKEWEIFMKSQPLLAAETLTYLADKNCHNVYAEKKTHTSPQKSILSRCFNVILISLKLLEIMLFTLFQLTIILIAMVVFISISLPPNYPSTTKRLCMYVSHLLLNYAKDLDQKYVDFGDSNGWNKYYEFLN